MTRFGLEIKQNGDFITNYYCTFYVIRLNWRLLTMKKHAENYLILSERHLIFKKHDYYNECDKITFLAKNLYNATLYHQRNSFFNKSFENYYSVNKRFAHSNQSDYRALPSKVSQQVQMLVDKAFKSYFALRKKKREQTFNKPISLPRYLHKTSGRCVTPYPKDALSLKEDGFIKLSKTNIVIKTKVPKDKIQSVRIVPKGNHFVLEVLYNQLIENPISDKIERVAFIDHGLNNLMTVTSNCFNPILYNGRDLKSINQLANKNIARLTSKLSKRGLFSSPLLQSIYSKRKRRIMDKLHKISAHLMNHLVSHNVDTVIFGYNKGQKQDIKLGKRINQNFVQIPISQLIYILEYKCKLKGIRFIVAEESYTSKCSFLDLEEIKHHEVYRGQRIKRGLFIDSSNCHINSDVNGSLNIGRKWLTNQLLYSEELHLELVKHMVNPKRLRVV